ncbi:motility protein A [Microbacterium sp. ASV49]|uniref:MotA/TolQ/ExbB proton channel family protein n=1 Tax=Microbacterium candidum TaxID=3041922 RepID=A0ABT7MTV3_9MICO|nr:MotA/TolQ/ExbB proton channel family protein [Microbacterium sp. ASV49]MDL9977868.1 MotA/TolQ/ExbB proton channel family protein [Microbacterium sp. ASV49]
MDPAFIIGVIIAFGALMGTISLEGASLNALLLPAPMLLVIGSTIGVGIASHTMRDSVLAVKSLGRMVRGPKSSPAAVIPILVDYAERARADGLLSLEQQVETASDDFTRQALQALADGTDAEDLRTVMEDEMAAVTTRNNVAAKYFSSLGGYAPTIGIVGTVVSLTHVLEQLDQPDHLGPMIASAFVATLWGLLSANFIWNPIAGRLNRIAAVELERMTIVTEGMLAIQAGGAPHHVQERLEALVSVSSKSGSKSGSKSASSATSDATSAKTGKAKAGAAKAAEDAS